MNCTSYLYIGIFAHILGLLYFYLLVALFLNTIFHNKLLLELEDIINICFVITFITFEVIKSNE
jgi:hypothetical protein